VLIIARIFIICRLFGPLSRIVRLQRHVANIEEKRNTHNVLMGKSEGKKLLGRLRRRIVGNIRLHRKGIGLVNMNWTNQAQNTRPF
jgi:hypothetical protein